MEALRRIAFELERGGARTYRVQAFRRAAQVLDGLPAGELERRIESGTLQALKGIGDTTAQVITEAAIGEEPGYLARLLAGPDRHRLTFDLQVEHSAHAWNLTRSPRLRSETTPQARETVATMDNDGTFPHDSAGEVSYPLTQEEVMIGIAFAQAHRTYGPAGRRSHVWGARIRVQTVLNSSSGRDAG